MPVHPRARGEHAFVVNHLKPLSGSSPRSRGTSTLPDECSFEIRFIPALAGNIPAAEHDYHYHAVHPRARGEHMPTNTARSLVFGSSPRSRGTSAARIALLNKARFIPALAGNIQGNLCVCCQRPVHPRARGEHPFGTPSWLRAYGSSPRSRGTWKASCRHCLLLRFIPALAGNIFTMRKPKPRTAVHPRARGEHSVVCCG